MRTEDEVKELKIASQTSMNYDARLVSDVLRWVLGEENWVGEYLGIDKMMKKIDKTMKECK